MSLTTDKECEHLGQSCGREDRDLIHELSRRLDCLWSLDQYIANAGGRREVEQK